jgi:hypothetical protein
MASVGEFTVLISRVGYTMARTPLGVLGDFLLRTCAGDDDDGWRAPLLFSFPPPFRLPPGHGECNKKDCFVYISLDSLRLASIVSSLYVFLGWWSLSSCIGLRGSIVLFHPRYMYWGIIDANQICDVIS